MASHRSTPKTVLNAPTRTVTVLSRQSGYNRAERRRGYRGLDAKGKPTILFRSKGTIPRDQQIPNRNRPYVRPAGSVHIVPSGSSVAGRLGSAVGRVRSTVAGARRADA